MKKILPFNINPPVISYQHHAFPLGVLFTNESFINDFVSNYVHLFYLRNDAIDPHAINFYRNDDYFAKDCFIKNMIMANGGNRFLIDYTLESFSDMLVFMIDNGYYVYGLIDEYYLPNRRAYKIKHWTHDFLIYGYEYSPIVVIVILISRANGASF